MAVNDVIATIQAQERKLVFDKFDEQVSWELASLLCDRGRQESAPIAIAIRFGNRLLFLAALAGATKDNEYWLRRKLNTVYHFGMSTYRLGREMEFGGHNLFKRYSLDEREFADHGGGFPIAVASAGIVGAVAVSGLRQLDDHMMVVHALSTLLGKDMAGLELPRPSS